MSNEIDVLSAFAGRELTDMERKCVEVRDPDVFSQLLNTIFLRGMEAGEQAANELGGKELINAAEVARRLDITRQAVGSFHRASRKPGYRGDFPKAAHEDPNGHNPLWDPDVIDEYGFRRSK